MPGWNRPFYCSRSQWNHSDKASLLEGGGFVRRTKTEGVERATLPYQPKPLYEKEKELLLPQSPSVTAPSSEGAFASYRPFYRLRWWWNSSDKTKSTRISSGALLVVEVTGLEPVTLLPVGRYRNQLYNKRKPPRFPRVVSNHGGSYRARTCDPLLVRQMLSQLS